MTYETKQQHVDWEGVHAHHPLSTKRFTEKKISAPIMPWFLPLFFIFFWHLETSGTLVP